MATIGRVAAIFTASTAGLKSAVADAGRSFRQLGGDSAALNASFDKLRAVSGQGLGLVGPAAEIAGRKLKTFEGLAARLQESLAAGRISADSFAEKMEAIRLASEAASSSLSRAAEITRQHETAEQLHARTTEELAALFREGALASDVYARAVASADSALAEANGTTAAAAQAARDAASAEQAMADAQGRAMDEFTSTMNRGAAVADEVATAEERHEARVRELRALLASGAISQTTFNRAVDKADDELRQASQSTSRFSRAVNSTDDALRKINSRLNTLIGINAAQLFGSMASAAADAVRSAVSFAASEAEVIDSTGKMAERLGMTYGEFAGLAHAAALADVSTESVAKAATKADIAFVKAANGSRTAQAAFAGIGLSVDELQGKSPAERFQMIAQAIAALPTEAERAAAATALFGRAGAELLPMFNGGAEAIASATAEADRFGLALTNDQRSSVEKMNDSFKNAYESIRGVVGQVVAYLSPALKSVSDQFSALIGGIGGANIGQFIGEGILAGAEFFATVADGFLTQLPAVWQFVSEVGAYWSGVLEFAGRVGNLLYGAFKVFEVVGNVIGGLFSDIVSGLYRAAAEIASVIPGFGDFAKGLNESADSWNSQARGFAASMNQNSDQAAAAFGAAFAETAAQAAAPQGPVASGLAAAIAKARADAAAQSSRPAPQTIGPGKPTQPAEAVFSGRSSEALKGIDSRSKEGVAEMFRLMRGTSGDVQQQQLDVLHQIHDDLSEADAETIIEMSGA